MAIIVRGTTTNPLVQKIQDASTGTQVTVKPASTAPVAADPAMVVAISPNTPVAVTTTAVSEGQYNTPLPTLTNGNYSPFQVNAKGLLMHVLADPTTGNQAAVTAFHNSDNQMFTGTTYGLFTGGVAQLKNAAQGLDRQSETGSDNISSLGISTGASQLASLMTISGGSTVAAGATSITISPASQLKQTLNGSNAWVQVGSVLTMEPGTTNQEQVVVTALNYGTGVLTVNGLGNGGANVGFKFSHTATYTINAFAYNQAKDATIGDNNSPAGIPAGAQYLLNATGTYNRQRETAFDNIPSAGIATGTQQVASPFSTTSTSTLSATTTPQVCTPAAMSGTVSGSPWSIQPGQTLLIDTGANQEKVQVLSVTSTTFTSVFSIAHGPSAFTITGFVYNQARDSNVADGSVSTGIPASGTYLFNTNANGGLGGVERERSAAGELDGASGTGSAIAVEYEFNSGGPISSPGSSYDRGRNLQGKGLGTGTISSGGGIGSNSITMTSVPTGLQPGSPVKLTGGTAETVYTTATYVAGANPILIQGTVQNASHTTASWDVYATSGPQLNGMLASGIEVEESVVYDPVTDLHYAERAATQDAVSGNNIVLECDALWNGSSFDRPRSVSGDAMTGTGVEAATDLLFNGSTYDRGRSGSAANLSGFQSVGTEMVTSPGNWTSFNSPAAASQATITKAAGAAGVRHVCNSITATVAAAGTAQTPIQIFLRDGATGTGTVLWTAQIAAPVNSVGVIAVSGLNIVGSSATAMTLEFSGAGVTGSFEAVTLTGYDAV